MKSKDPLGYDYTIWLNDVSRNNLKKLIAHCDKKIDDYFAKLDAYFVKEIEKVVKKEVRRILKGKK